MFRTGLTLVAALAAAHTLADARLEMTDGADDDDGMIINVSNGKLAFEEGGVPTMLYDAKTDAFTYLNHAQKGYVVMDKAAMKEVGDQMDSMMKEVQAQLASLPPEQREAMMQMMPGMADRMKPKSEAPKADIDFTGDSAKVGGYSCKIARISGLADGANEVCVAKPKALGISGDDFDTMTRAFDMMQKAANRFGQGAPFPSARELGGVPIRVRDDEGVTSLTRVSTDKIDAAVFEIPAGYSQQSIME